MNNTTLSPAGQRQLIQILSMGEQRLIQAYLLPKAASERLCTIIRVAHNRNAGISEEGEDISIAHTPFPGLQHSTNSSCRAAHFPLSFASVFQSADEPVWTMRLCTSSSRRRWPPGLTCLTRLALHRLLLQARHRSPGSEAGCKPGDHGPFSPCAPRSRRWRAKRAHQQAVYKSHWGKRLQCGM